MLIEKLLQVPINFKLSNLYLEYLEYPSIEDSSHVLANALCRVKGVSLGPEFPLDSEMLDRLVQNILHHQFSMEWDGMVWHGQRSRIQSLSIHQDILWSTLITTEDLKNLITKIRVLDVLGMFTEEQVQAAKSLPGIRVLEVNENCMRIVKC